MKKMSRERKSLIFRNGIDLDEEDNYESYPEIRRRLITDGPIYDTTVEDDYSDQYYV